MATWCNMSFKSCTWDDFETWVLDQMMATINKLEHIGIPRKMEDPSRHAHITARFIYDRNEFPDKSARYGIPQMDAKAIEKAIMMWNPSRMSNPPMTIDAFLIEGLYKRYYNQLCFTSFPSDSTFNILNMLAPRPLTLNHKP